MRIEREHPVANDLQRCSMLMARRRMDKNFQITGLIARQRLEHPRGIVESDLMGNDLCDIYAARANEFDRAGVIVTHAPHKCDLELPASRVRRRQRVGVAIGNAREHDPPPDARASDRIAKCSRTVGRFDDQRAPALGRTSQKFLDRRCDAGRAEIERGSAPMGLRLDDMHLAGPGDSQRLQDEESDRACAEKRNALEKSRLGKVDGVNRDPQWLKHRRLKGPESVRQRRDLRFGNPDLLGHCPVEWRRADEPHVGTKVATALAAPFAAPARNVGVNRDQRAPRETAFRHVFAKIAAKFVARNERLDDGKRTDAAILKIMEIAAANTGRRDFDERFAQLPLARRDRAHTRVANSIQENRSAQPEILLTFFSQLIRRHLRRLTFCACAVSEAARERKLAESRE